MDLNEAKLESLKRSEQVNEIDKFINSKGQDNEENKPHIKNKDIKDIIEHNEIDWSQF